MSRSRMWLLVGVCAFVCAASLVGLLVALSGPDEASPSTPNLSVDVVVVPEVMTAVHKVYAGQSGAFLAKTVIKNNGSEPVTNFHIGYKIPGYAEIAGQEDYPVILPGQNVHVFPVALTAPSEAAAMPLPNEDTTPPVMKINRVIYCLEFECDTIATGRAHTLPDWRGFLNCLHGTKAQNSATGSYYSAALPVNHQAGLGGSRIEGFADP